MMDEDGSSTPLPRLSPNHYPSLSLPHLRSTPQPYFHTFPHPLPPTPYLQKGQLLLSMAGRDCRVRVSSLPSFTAALTQTCALYLSSAVSVWHSLFNGRIRVFSPFSVRCGRGKRSPLPLPPAEWDGVRAVGQKKPDGSPSLTLWWEARSRYESIASATLVAATIMHPFQLLPVLPELHSSTTCYAVDRGLRNLGSRAG